MRLIIVRHGETDHNKTGTHIGRLDAPLNDRGREQAELVGARLARENIDVIYTINLIRARTTAEFIARHHPQNHLLMNHYCENTTLVTSRESRFIRANLSVIQVSRSIEQNDRPAENPPMI